MLLQIATAFSLQSAIDLLQITTGIAKCDDYYNCDSTNQSIKSINQLYLNTVNGSASWFLDMPCDNYNL